jgi:hypothetical protein
MSVPPTGPSLTVVPRPILQETLSSTPVKNPSFNKPTSFCKLSVTVVERERRRPMFQVLLVYPCANSASLQTLNTSTQVHDLQRITHAQDVTSSLNTNPTDSRLLICNQSACPIACLIRLDTVVRSFVDYHVRISIMRF